MCVRTCESVRERQSVCVRDKACVCVCVCVCDRREYMVVWIRNKTFSFDRGLGLVGSNVVIPSLFLLQKLSACILEIACSAHARIRQFRAFFAAAAHASSCSSATDPPGAAPFSSIPQIQPSPLLPADERPIPSSAPPQRPLPLSARAEAPFLAILDDRRDLNWAWKAPPSPLRL